MHIKLFAGMLLAAILITACAGPETGAPISAPASPTTIISPTAAAPQPTGSPTAILPAALQAVQQTAAEQAGVAVTDTEILNFEYAEWPNSCLGWANAGESCLEVITPGYGGQALRRETRI